MELKELMDGFAARVGLADVAPYAEGAYALAFDGMDVGFTEIQPGGELLLAAPFARKPAESSDRLAEVLLAANHFFAETAGATISLDLAAEQYVLQRRVPLALLDVDAFFALVEAFVNKLASFRALVADFRPVFDQAADASRKAQEESASMSFSGFMQV